MLIDSQTSEAEPNKKQVEETPQQQTITKRKLSKFLQQPTSPTTRETLTKGKIFSELRGVGSHKTEQIGSNADFTSTVKGTQDVNCQHEQKYQQILLEIEDIIYRINEIEKLQFKEQNAVWIGKAICIASMYPYFDYYSRIL